MSKLVHLDVEVRSEELLAPALLCHKGAYNRTFPCMEATYPLCHKEPARSKQRPVGSLRSKAPSMGLWMPELVLYGIRELAPATYLDQ